MTFVDFLAFQEVLLLVAAVMVAYVGAAAAFAMRHNDTAGLKSILRTGAIPIGSVGVVATIIAIYGEMAWPLTVVINGTNVLASYNIFFTDVYVLFGATLIVLAASMALGQRLQFAGLFGLISGGVTWAYGYAGYGLGLTKDPLETFLLYGAFGLAAVLAFPATFMVDHYLVHPESSVFAAKVPLAQGAFVARRRPAFAGASRAVQPVPGASTAPEEPTTVAPTRFRIPAYFNAVFIAFIVAMALAAVAALLYLNTTVPGHLAAAP